MASGSRSIHSVILFILSLATAILVAWVVYNGWDFYTTAYSDRPHHEDFRDMRSAGYIGHGLGILGTLMVLLLLLYTARKRMKFMSRWGDVRVWLRYHIFLGVAGPILITLHTSFKFNGLVSISYWSMVAVALSGVVGRYLYQQIPRNMLGETLGAEDIESRNEELLVELSTNHGLGDKALDSLEKLAVGKLENHAAPVALILLPWVNIFLARKLLSFFVGYSIKPDPQALGLCREWVLQTRRLLLFHQIRDLFHYWHVFHKPFAVIMILVMVVHVAVAVALGYTWQFGGNA
jgi:hypothetical protein